MWAFSRRGRKRFGYTTMTDDPRTRRIKPWRDRETIEFLRFERGYKQGRIAELLGVAQVTISRWEERHGFPERRMGPKRGSSQGSASTPATFRTYQKGRDTMAYEYIFDGTSNRYFRHHRLLALLEYDLAELSDRVVHHKNGIGWDNRADNIEAVTRAEHNRIHHKLEPAENP